MRVGTPRVPHTARAWSPRHTPSLGCRSRPGGIVGFLHTFHIVAEPTDGLKESMLLATQIDGESITTLQPIAIGPPGSEPSVGGTVWPAPRPSPETDNPFFFEPGQGRARVHGRPGDLRRPGTV
jgi:hypothetical protein